MTLNCFQSGSVKKPRTKKKKKTNCRQIPQSSAGATVMLHVHTYTYIHVLIT